jgi:hypothetical protein
MENIVQTGTCRQLQVICHIIDALRHLERPEIFQPQLAAVGDVDGRSWPVNEAKPNPLTNIEHVLTMALIVEVLACYSGHGFLLRTHHIPPAIDARLAAWRRPACKSEPQEGRDHTPPGTATSTAKLDRRSCSRTPPTTATAANGGDDHR